MERFNDHLIAWSVAVFVGMVLFFSKGGIVLAGQIYWYSPFVWILAAAAVVFLCGVAAAIPALATSYISEQASTWNKPRKAALWGGVFVVVILWIALAVPLK